MFPRRSPGVWSRASVSFLSRAMAETISSAYGALVERDLVEKQLQPPILGHKIRLALEPRSDVVQLHRPGRDDRDDDVGKATATGVVEFGSLVNADANPVDDCTGHGGVLREEVI